MGAHFGGETAIYAKPGQKNKEQPSQMITPYTMKHYILHLY